MSLTLFTSMEKYYFTNPAKYIQNVHNLHIITIPKRHFLL